MTTTANDNGAGDRAKTGALVAKVEAGWDTAMRSSAIANMDEWGNDGEIHDGILTGHQAFRELVTAYESELTRLQTVVDAAVAWAHMPDDWTLGDVGNMLVEDLERKVRAYEDTLRTASAEAADDANGGDV